MQIIETNTTLPFWFITGNAINIDRVREVQMLNYF